MQVSVPPGETVRVVTRRIEESVGHARVCGLFIALYRSTCRAKDHKVRDAADATT
jgi:hypothetical protein